MDVVNKSLEPSYKEMAKDEQREAEALDRAEAAVRDVLSTKPFR